MFRTSIACAAIAAAFATPAAAQQAGTYNGTDASGDGLSLTLATDPATHKLAITAESVGLPAHGSCKPATTQTLVGYGTGFMQDLKGPKATLTFNFPNTYTVTTMTFSGNTVSGTIVTYETIFVDVAKGRPKKASFCTVPTQTYSMTLGAPAVVGAHVSAHTVRLD